MFFSKGAKLVTFKTQMEIKRFGKKYQLEKMGKPQQEGCKEATDNKYFEVKVDIAG